MDSTEPYRKSRDFEICGVGFCATTRREFVKEAFSMPVSPVSGTIDLIGVPGVISANENEEVADAYATCSFAAIDGMPIVRIARKRGFKCERCAAPDIMGMMFEESVIRGKTHFFYGGKDDTVLSKLRERLERDYPKIEIVGMYSPPFHPLSDEEDQKICSEINSANPDFVWVGIGAPKQEIWMREHIHKINGVIMIGVGAGFDYFAGTLKKAPMWVENIGLEWLYRFLKEPRRLGKRYIIGGLKWLYYRNGLRIL